MTRSPNIDHSGPGPPALHIIPVGSPEPREFPERRGLSGQLQGYVGCGDGNCPRHSSERNRHGAADDRDDEQFLEHVLLLHSVTAGRRLAVTDRHRCRVSRTQ